MNYYLGIDPGRMGGMALLDENRNLIFFEVMPSLPDGYNYDLIADMIDKLDPGTSILLELKPGVMNKSASPTTSFGFHCGVLFGLCYRHRLIIVSPKTWKTEFDLTRNYQETRHDMKQRSIQVAEKLFHKTFKSTEDGLAEALLLAEYGRRYKL